MRIKRTRTRLTEAEIDDIVVGQAEDDSAWGEPIQVPAKPWAERVRVKRLDLAAKFHVLSILYRLGADATVSVGPEKSVDITVVRKPGEVFTVDVKAAPQSKVWSVNDFKVNRNHFVVFVYFKGSTTQPNPDSYILNSRELVAWAGEHDGIIDIRKLARSARGSREAWERLIPAA